MPKRPSGSGGMYNSRIMAATLYLPKAGPYIVFNNRFFTLVPFFVMTQTNNAAPMLVKY